MFDEQKTVYPVFPKYDDLSAYQTMWVEWPASRARSKRLQGGLRLPELPRGSLKFFGVEFSAFDNAGVVVTIEPLELVTGSQAVLNWHPGSHMVRMNLSSKMCSSEYTDSIFVFQRCTPQWNLEIVPLGSAQATDYFTQSEIFMIGRNSNRRAGLIRTAQLVERIQEYKVVDESKALQREISRMARGIKQRVAVSGTARQRINPIRTLRSQIDLRDLLMQKWHAQKGLCNLCNKPIPLTPSNSLLQMSPDREDSGNTVYDDPDNVFITHLGCNVSKLHHKREDWLEWFNLTRTE